MPVDGIERQAETPDKSLSSRTRASQQSTTERVSKTSTQVQLFRLQRSAGNGSVIRLLQLQRSGDDGSVLSEIREALIQLGLINDDEPGNTAVPEELPASPDNVARAKLLVRVLSQRPPQSLSPELRAISAQVAAAGENGWTFFLHGVRWLTPDERARLRRQRITALALPLLQYYSWVLLLDSGIGIVAEVGTREAAVGAEELTAREAGNAASKGAEADAQVLARQLARQCAEKNEAVIVNLGGAGASHEPLGAININNQAVARVGIPNLVKADGSAIGELFDANSIDRIEGHNMAPGVISWDRAAPGAYSALKPGGTFEYYYRGANSDAAVLGKALTAAGFRDVSVVSDVLVKAVK